MKKKEGVRDFLAEEEVRDFLSDPDSFQSRRSFFFCMGRASDHALGSGPAPAKRNP